MFQASATTAANYEIRFQSLFHEGRGIAFPCDCEGNVDLGSMNERARSSYALACARVGVDYATPMVLVSARH